MKAWATFQVLRLIHYADRAYRYVVSKAVKLWISL